MTLLTFHGSLFFRNYIIKLEYFDNLMILTTKIAMFTFIFPAVMGYGLLLGIFLEKKFVKNIENILRYF